VREGELGRWKLVEEFRQVLAETAKDYPLHPTFSDPDRLLTYGNYLSLFLFGLLNPVVRTLRGLCEATHLHRVREDICQRRVSLGSFSAAQPVLDPALLEKVFVDLSGRLQAPWASDPRLATRKWMAHDGSLWRALPRMSWALYGAGRGGDSHAVKLHLSFHVLEDKPVKATVRRGKDCERAVWQCVGESRRPRTDFGDQPGAGGVAGGTGQPVVSAALADRTVLPVDQMHFGLPALAGGKPARGGDQQFSFWRPPLCARR